MDSQSIGAKISELLDEEHGCKIAFAMVFLPTEPTGETQAAVLSNMPEKTVQKFFAAAAGSEIVEASPIYTG